MEVPQYLWAACSITLKVRVFFSLKGISCIWGLCLLPLVLSWVPDTIFHNGKEFSGFKGERSMGLGEAGRDEHPWPCPAGATHDKTDPPSSMWAFVDLQKSLWQHP